MVDEAVAYKCAVDVDGYNGGAFAIGGSCSIDERDSLPAGGVEETV